MTLTGTPGRIASIAALVERVVRRLADAQERPRVIQAEAPARGDGDTPGYGPYLGTVPAFGGAPVRGVRLQAVRAGSPAEQAGLRADDVIVEFADAPVANLEELDPLGNGDALVRAIRLQAEVLVEAAGAQVRLQHPQHQGRVSDVLADLALVNNALFVRVGVFNRVLNGHHMTTSVHIAIVNKCRQRR